MTDLSIIQPFLYTVFDNETLTAEVMTTYDIVGRPVAWQENLRQEMSRFLSRVFQSPKDWEYMVRHFFWVPEENCRRVAVLVRNKAYELVAMAICDHGVFPYESGLLHLVYIHARAILPEYQGMGLGKKLSLAILNDLNPDILYTSCAQSSSLHSWVALPEKKQVKGYKAYPRLVTLEDGSRKAMTCPLHCLGFALDNFKNIYLNHVKGSFQRVEDVVRNITVFLIRKNVCIDYDYDPWMRQGAPDLLAKALKLEAGDCVLAMLVKDEVDARFFNTLK